MADPKVIDSKYNRHVTRDGATVELCIYRLEDTKWTLELVDANGTSIVWDDEFDTDDAAFGMFLRAIDEEGGLDSLIRDPKRSH